MRTPDHKYSVLGNTNQRAGPSGCARRSWFPSSGSKLTRLGRPIFTLLLTSARAPFQTEDRGKRCACLPTPDPHRYDATCSPHETPRETCSLRAMGMSQL